MVLFLALLCVKCSQFILHFTPMASLFAYDALVPTSAAVKKAVEARIEHKPVISFVSMMVESDDEEEAQQAAAKVEHQIEPRMRAAREKIETVVAAVELDIQLLRPVSSVPGVSINVLTNAEALSLMRADMKMVGRHKETRMELGLMINSLGRFSGMGKSMAWQKATEDLRDYIWVDDSGAVCYLEPFQVATISNTWPWTAVLSGVSDSDVSRLEHILCDVGSTRFTPEALQAIADISRSL